jgi:RNA polymerase sigma factor (sigma-70 family)
MSKAVTKNREAGHRRLMVAVVLGTALSAVGSAQGVPAAPSPTHLEAASDISRYCTACWRNARLHPDSWADCTQEVFSRLLSRVAPESWPRALQGDGAERREFFRAIDAVKKRSQRARRLAALTDDSISDARDPYERQRVEERRAVRDLAEQILSDRQRKILDFSFDGWSVQEIAEEMKLSTARVSDEKYKAIRKLRESLAPVVN